MLRDSAASYRTVWTAAQEARAREQRDRQDQEHQRRALNRPPPQVGEWLTPAEAGDLLGLTANGVKRRIARETLPATQVGRRWWVRRDHIESVLNAAAFRRRAAGQ